MRRRVRVRWLWQEHSTWDALQPRRPSGGGDAGELMVTGSLRRDAPKPSRVSTLAQPSDGRAALREQGQAKDCTDYGQQGGEEGVWEIRG